jgi:glycosyltransferase involved in cell wall biosynthesis
MRVLVLSSVFPNSRQPALGVFIRERMRRVAAACEVVVVAPRPWFPLNGLARPQWTGIPPLEHQDGLRVYHPPFLSVPGVLKWLDGSLYALSLVRFLSRLRREFPFELIDAHFAYPDGVAAVLLGRVFRCPVTITLRGSIVRLSRYPLHRPQLRFALRQADRVLSVSQSLRDVAVAVGDIPPAKVRVVPNGVDVSLFFPRDRADARRRLGLPPDRKILLSIGGLEEGKGHHRIVDLLPRLLQQWPDLLYVIVGGGRPSDTVRPLLGRLVERHALSEHVVLAGERPHAEIPWWLSAADLFCLATRSEGWCNVLLEAAACGRPVVTTRVGGNSEVVPSLDLGLLVPPDDDTALEHAIDEALRRPWNQAPMLAHAGKHSWAAAARTVVEEFGRLTAGDGAPTGVTTRTRAATPDQSRRA